MSDGASSSSGPKVARLFLRLLGAVFLVAWLSLGSQLDVLVGSRGLLPIAPYLEALRERGIGFWEFPTLLWWGASDFALRAGASLGTALAALALFGAAPRLCLGLSTLLYLGFVVAARNFTSFQWDNLLIECGALAVLLPTNRPAPWIHFLFRVALFKLYFESGLAKYQSVLHDWHDGSAMTFYYETAPLPTALGWFAHRLPPWWHHFESRATLVWELGVPLLIFLPRPFRLVAFVCFSGFQLVNAATANYGFFCHLALVLGVFLLAERDFERAAATSAALWRRALSKLPALERAATRLAKAWRRVRDDARGRLGAIRFGIWRPRRVRPADPSLLRALRALRALGATSVVTLYLTLSLSGALRAFADEPLDVRIVTALEEAAHPFRLVNVYHLFAQITRERIEPEFQIEAGDGFRAYDLRYKPGTLGRAPPFVAPHQPRVDFLLWFYGLQVRRQQGRSVAPPLQNYVGALLDRLCHDPAAVAPLFERTLPPSPEAVRIVFYRYRFSTPEERHATGAWWRREELTRTRSFRCSRDQ